LAEVVLIPLNRIVTRRQWHGRENIPRTGGVLVVVNHVSYIDPVTFAYFVNSTGRVPKFLAKAELFDHPYLGRVFKGTDQIPVRRGGQSASGSVQAASDAVRRGGCVVVYPEATLTRDPHLWPMVGKTGAARIALETGVPVIPCAQWGAHRILAPYARKPTILPRRTVYARAGTAVDLSDLRTVERTPAVLAEATDRIMAAITAELETIRGERAPAVRFDPRKAGIAEYGRPTSAGDPGKDHR
jgi:1-acyl-sn-glycerol-3-phosphate acyltransferase